MITTYVEMGLISIELYIVGYILAHTAYTYYVKFTWPRSGDFPFKLDTLSVEQQEL